MNLNRYPKKMKSSVFVLVEGSEPRDKIVEVAKELINRHRMPQDSSEGRFDYLVAPFETTFEDQAAEYMLPESERRAYKGLIARVAEIGVEIIPSSLVTPDGTWHDLSDFGWRMVGAKSENKLAISHWEDRCRSLLAEHPDCLALEFCAHS